MQLGQRDDREVEVVGISTVEDRSDEQRAVDAHGKFRRGLHLALIVLFHLRLQDFRFFLNLSNAGPKRSRIPRGGVGLVFFGEFLAQAVQLSAELVHFVLRLDQLLPHAVQLAGELVEVAVQFRIVQKASQRAGARRRLAVRWRRQSRA